MTEVVPTGRAPGALALCCGLAAVLVAARGVLFMAPGLRFDADQAVVGLMAKHISEGRAFPVYFYGQSYLPALEAYLAGPVMWLLGPTEAALKVPIVAMNVAAALLLVWFAVRDLRLSPWLALAGALPLIVPPLVPGTRFMDAMGGNVEPLLATLLLWLVRERRWAFGIVLGTAVVVREISLFAVAALLLLDLWSRGWRRPATRERWAIAVLLVGLMSAGLDALRPHGAMFGPGTTARPADLDLSGGDALREQLCVDPSRWPARASRLLADHLPMMIGGTPGGALPAGLNSGVTHGNAGLRSWVPALLAAAAVAAVAAARRRARTRPSPGEGRVPPTAFSAYLVVTGLVSLGAYGLVACSQISIDSVRYDLLVTLVPVGVILAGLAWPSRPVRAGLVTATLLWCATSAIDYAALADEAWHHRRPDYRGEAVTTLEARGLTVLWGDFRLAYVLSFRSAERVVVAPTTVHRIDEYAARAAAAGAPLVRVAACAPEGEELAPGIWLCPGPDAGARPRRPPVY